MQSTRGKGWIQYMPLYSTSFTLSDYPQVGQFLVLHTLSTIFTTFILNTSIRLVILYILHAIYHWFFYKSYLMLNDSVI